jgi:hypothetical protein
MVHRNLSDSHYEIGKRRKTNPSTLEKLIKELKSIGLARLNVIGNGQISTYVAELEMEIKDKYVKSLE